MASLARVLLALLAVACVVALTVACGSGDDSVRDDASGSEPVAAEDLPLVEIPTRWASANARDMQTLIASTGTVFIGEVTGVSQRITEVGAAPSGGPGRPAAVPISQFQVTVVQSLRGAPVAGESVVVEQPGGVTTRVDGSQARIVLEGDEPIQVGRTYLFFASARADGILTTAPFGRFVVGADGSLESPGAFSASGVARQLSGLSLEEAAAEVRNAR